MEDAASVHFTKKTLVRLVEFGLRDFSLYAANYRCLPKTDQGRSICC
jgi:hypothetical protein